MAQVIRFTTDAFDVSQERPNPINPIFGESLLRWLEQRLPSQTHMSEPDAEDWGWYCDLRWNGRAYLLGACASEGDGPQREWILQIEKHRTLTEKLLGRARMTADDECARYLQRLLESEPAFHNVAADGLTP